MMDWLNEQDYYSMTIKGYKCEIKRNSLGALCGYITVSPKHPALQDTESLIVHGGITYENNNVLGFDCAHHDDYVPQMSNFNSEATYKNVEFVINELTHLAHQLLADDTLMNQIKLKYTDTLGKIKENTKFYIQKFFM